MSFPLWDRPEAGSIGQSGDRMHDLIRELYPICRSITGEGVRRTLAAVRSRIPLEIRRVASGEKVFDWTVPLEWNVREAWIKDPAGRKIVDFRQHNLHLVGYSSPVHARVSLEELRPRLHSLPDHPDWIPYRTSYYAADWGFCLPHRQMCGLAEGDYEVLIDSTLAPGFLDYGECLLPGESGEDVLISAHVCHPSMCNDNLSGIALAVELADFLRRVPLRHSCRFLFIPGTIGSIAWLAANRTEVHKIRAGLVLTCAGDPGPFTYKRSRRGDAGIDRAFEHVLGTGGRPHAILDFSPYGYDERQYCSPGFNLPAGCFMRSAHGAFPEYHTSADDPDFVTPGALAESLDVCLRALHLLEHDRAFRNLNPYCEPQLGRRGLYGGGGGTGVQPDTMAMLWVLNLSDGTHSLLDIANRSGKKFDEILSAAAALHAAGLLASDQNRPAAAVAG